jgi:hypothetical protein
MTSPTSGPLRGYRVLDLADEMGALCGKMFADLGQHTDEVLSGLLGMSAAEIERLRDANRIRERYGAWADCGITGLHIGTSQAAVIELMADIVLTAEPVRLAR